MSKRKRSLQMKERKLRCPACGKSIEDTATATQAFVLPGEPTMLPHPGDLTECHHCLTMLEYRGAPPSLTLHPAPQERVDRFNDLTREAPCEPSLPELINYVRKYRQMPMQPPTGHRFRRILNRKF